MERRIEVDHQVRASADRAGRALMDDADAVFAPLAAAAGPTGPNLLVDLGAHGPGGASAGHAVELSFSPPRRTTGGRVVMELSWQPAGHRRLVPAFHGQLELLPDGRFSILRLHGTYRPPLGPVGLILDRVAGRRVARRTLEEALARLADRLEAVVLQALRDDPLPALYAPDLRGWPSSEEWLG